MCGWVDSKGGSNIAGLFAHCYSHESSYPAMTTTTWSCGGRIDVASVESSGK